MSVFDPVQELITIRLNLCGLQKAISEECEKKNLGDPSKEADFSDDAHFELTLTAKELRVLRQAITDLWRVRRGLVKQLRGAKVNKML